MTLAVVFAQGSRFHAQAGATVTRIEVNQALGVQLNNARRFVAGKDTAIRVFMSGEVTVDPEETSLAVVRGGTTVVTLPPRSYQRPTRVVDFLCPTRAACGDWAPGSYVLNATVNGATASTAGTTYTFVERRELRVLGVPVKLNYGGRVAQVIDDPQLDPKWKQLWQFSRDTYPVAADKLRFTERGEFDASSFDLNTEPGRRALWDALGNLQPPTCAANRAAAGCYEKIIGFIPNNRRTANGALAGYTYGDKAVAVVVVVRDQDAAATVAHEIGHTFDLGDTYNNSSLNCAVNPAPDGYSGNDFNTNEPVTCTAGKTAFPEVQATRIPADHAPYEVTGRGTLPEMADYMGCCGGEQANFWTTQENYDGIFDGLALRPARARLRAPERFIEFSGSIRRNAVSAADVMIEPWYSFMDAEVIANSVGESMIAAVDAVGNRLATENLALDFFVPGPRGMPPQIIEQAPFEGAMRFPLGTVKFQILRGTTVLREILVSRNVPQVAGVTPISTTLINGAFTVSWNASDADGDALRYAVLYDPDVTRDDWEVLAFDLTSPFFVQDFDELAGGDDARIRIDATDGILTGSAESAAFRVSPKALEVFIDDLEQTRYPIGEEVVLAGEAFDLQYGDVPDNRLQWSSNLSGVLGTGPTLVIATLPAGEHIITLRATNSRGLTASYSVQITVGAVSSKFIEFVPNLGATTLSNSFGGLNMVITVPGSSVTGDTFVEFESREYGTGAPAGINAAIRYFSLTADRALGSVTLAVDYPQPYGNIVDTSTLRLMRWNGARWVDAATECQPASTYDTSVAGRVTVRACTLGEFAVTADDLAKAVSLLDLDGNGRDDAFLYNSTSGAWMTAFTVPEKTGQWSASWQAQSADLNGDGRPDLFLYNPDSGVWFQVLNQGNNSYREVRGQWDRDWTVQFGDANGDGRADALLYNRTTGTYVTGFSDGNGGFTNYVGATWTPGWRVFLASFNGDRFADVFLYNNETGVWFIGLSNGAGGFAYTRGHWDPNWQVFVASLDSVPGDDLFLSNQRTGTWVKALTMASGNGFTYVSGAWAAGRDVRIVDLDGNGRDDVFTYDRITGAWLEAFNVSDALFSAFTGTWSPGWTIFGGDMNGDRAGDLLLYNPGTGVWFQAFPAGGGQFTYVSASWARSWKMIGQP